MHKSKSLSTQIFRKTPKFFQVSHLQQLKFKRSWQFVTVFSIVSVHCHQKIYLNSRWIFYLLIQAAMNECYSKSHLPILFALWKPWQRGLLETEVLGCLVRRWHGIEKPKSMSWYPFPTLQVFSVWRRGCFGFPYENRNHKIISFADISRQWMNFVVTILPYLLNNIYNSHLQFIFTQNEKYINIKFTINTYPSMEHTILHDTWNHWTFPL